MTSTIEQIFKLFTLKDNNDHRVWFREPFKQDKYICATNLHYLICTEEKNIDFKVENMEGVNYPDTGKLINSVIQRAESDYLLCENILKIDKETFEKAKIYIKEQECELCNGKGSVQWEYEEYTKWDKCPACDGNKLVEKKQGIEKEFSKDMVVKIDSTFPIYIEASYFDKLMQVQQILNKDIVLLSTKGNNVLFSIGDFLILTLSIFTSLVEENLEKYKIITEIKLKG